MQTRLGIIQIFSTFVQFREDTFAGWLTDSRLRRSIKICCEQAQQEEPESFWALYWHKVWQKQSSPIAAAHISAYLQEVCYWVASKIALNFKNQSVADCFQIAIERIPKILKKFNSEFSSNLKAYAELSFESSIKDSLRLRHETDICTDWALLHKISRKRLIDSLQNAGFTSQIIDTYVLAWECFKELYTAKDTKTRKLLKPEAVTWEKITNLYNEQRQSQLSVSTPTATPEILEKWLSQSAKAVRAFVSPKFVSVDATVSGCEESNLLDFLPVDDSESLIEDIIAREEAVTNAKQIMQLQDFLSQAITKLDVQSQKLLEAYYGKQLTQQEIGQQLEIKQYNVSRRLTSIKRSLLQSLAQWSSETLHIAPAPNVLGAMNTGLEEWLKKYYISNS